MHQLTSFLRSCAHLTLGLLGGLGIGFLIMMLSSQTALAAGTVGNGTPGSCNGDLLAVKMAGGGAVTFNCGGPATLSISNTQTIAVDTAIDGTNNGSPVTITTPSGTQLFHVNSNVALTLTALTVANVSYYNGPIANFGGRVVVSGSNFLNNSSGVILNNSAGGTIVAVQTLFSNTTGTGAIANYNGAAIITASQFISNSGAIYAANAGVIHVADSIFTQNHTMYGAGIYMNGASTELTVTGSTFYSNTASDGAGIGADSGTAFISNTTFYSNSASGAIWYQAYGDAGMQIINSTFISNTNGGVDTNSGANTPLLIAGSKFINNDGGYTAGGVRASGFTLTVTQSSFIGNHTTSNNFSGALSAGGPTYITGSTFIGNSGPQSGGMDMGNVGVPAFVDTVANTLVQSNTATNYDGGGIQARVPLILSYDSIMSNTTTGGIGANGYGAGLAFENGGAAFTVTHSLFFNNVTSHTFAYGGGIYVSGNGLIVDSTIVSNTASAGGGVYLSLGNLSLVNDTLISNTAAYPAWPGGNLMNAGLPSALNALNTILSGGAPSNCYGNWLSLGHNLAADASCPLTHTTDLSGTNPLLGPLQDNGGPTWSLLPTLASPVINAGTNAGCPLDDQRGLPRPYNGGVCDIGALEYQGNIHHTFVPVTLR